MPTAAAPRTTADPSKADLAASLRVSVARLARVLRRQDNDDLTPTAWGALTTIFRDGPMTLGDVARSEHVSAPTVTKVVEKLETAGLVTRVADDGDRRVCRVQVSPAGRRRIEAIRAKRTAWLLDRLASLSEDELARLAAAAPVLEKLGAQE